MMVSAMSLQSLLQASRTRIWEEDSSGDREVDIVAGNDVVAAAAAVEDYAEDCGACIAREHSLMSCWNESQPGHSSQPVCMVGMCSFVHAVWSGASP